MSRVDRTWMLLLMSALFLGVLSSCGNPEKQVTAEPEIIRMKLPKPEKPSSVKPSPKPTITSAAPSAETHQGAVPSESQDTTREIAQPMLPDQQRVLYKVEGKIDPFQPLIREEPVEKASLDSKTQRKKRIPQTPLERLDLSQLRLTAIIRTASGYRALVEESTGKGYIIGVGTYLGLNGGRVVAIHKDRFVLEEEIEDALGNVKTEQRDIRLPKPTGDPS
uniref:Pilus assembly protein PilP n=1 Tax=Desulfatirhabdium butyrativorans TaxID=340467 RepID=A0A7C4ML33_9BACT